MKRYIFIFGIIILFFSTSLLSQSVTATYTVGNGNTDYSFTALPGSSTCPLALSVTIPVGAVITGTDVSYSMTALGGGWMSEQRSQIRCVSAGGTAEATLFSGSGTTAGTFAYNRTGLSIANGVAGGGTINFQLHAGRTYGGSGCGTTYNYVNNSWTITVYYYMPVACSGSPNNGVAAISSTTGCVGTNFTLSATGVTLGTGISYQWQSSASASGPWSNITGATGTSYSTSVATTTYYQLLTTCSNSGITSTSNVVSYNVTGNACQCGTYPANYSSTTYDEEITSVTVGTMTNTSTCATVAPGPGSILNRYSNYTGFVAGPTVQLGEIVNFSLTQASCGGSYGNGFQIYIDYNQDGDFADAGEQAYSQPTAATGNHTKTGSFTIPLGATQGVSRMRIVNVETTFPTTNNYANTTTFSYGETEDYCITILAATACAGTPEAGNASPATQQVSVGSSATLSLVGASAMSGLNYQWQNSSSPGGPFSNITGANSINYTTPALTVDTYYRCIVTCTASGGSDISAVGEVAVVTTVNMYTGSINTCGSLFYDSGGAAGNYAVSENYTLTVYPDVPGSKVVVSFTSFNVENNYEDFYIYNGNSVTAPLLGTYTGTATIPSFTSTAADGSLTFNFTSDASVQYAGWVANLTCYNPCVYITPTFAAVGPYCAGMPINPLPTTSLEGRTGTWAPAINNMATTTYTFTPNAGECAYTTTKTITINPNNPASFTQVGPFCEGTTIAALPLTSNNGINGTWSPAIDNMNTTEYTFVADGSVCAWTTMEIEIDTVPSGITNNSGSDVLTCSLQNISLTATGGVTYSWTGGPASVLASRVVSAPATYTVTVNGANGCSTTESIVITQDITPPTVVITNDTGTDELICTVPSISLTASGGVTYAWSGGATPTSATNNFTFPGTFVVTVTGSNGCSATESYVISQPAPLDITENVLDALCFSLPGSAEVVINSGGNTPYSIIWQDGNTTFDNNSIPANTLFGYTITDGDLCTTTGDVYVNDPDLLTVNIAGTDSKCYGSDDGTANASNTLGGTVPYLYNWNNGSNSVSLSGLNPGTYRVTVTDDNGCSANNSVIIAEPTEIVVDFEVTDATCGATGGIINTDVTGGAGGFTYIWSNGGSINNISSLAPAIYTLTVTDANFCTATSSATVNRVGDILADISIVHPISCAGIPDGILQANSVNGTFPLSFFWNNGSSADILSSVPAGTYYLTVTDDWGCTGSAIEALTLPDEIILDYYVTDLTCYGLNNGKINISLSGGDPPFLLEWSNLATGTALNSLAAGQYSLTVTDSRNCVILQDFVINQPNPIVFDYFKTDVTCYGLSDGSLIMNASGGSEPYSYTVSTNQIVSNTPIVNSLRAGNYTLNVTDNNNCAASGSVAIYQPAELTAKITASNPSCIGNNDGFIAVYPMGGTAPYSYIFDNMDMDTSVYARLREGNYIVFLSDANGCEYEVGSVRLNEALYECLVVPSAFTPNNDGINDKWEIRNLELYPGANIHVFNRWGQEVYSGRHDSDPWDGKFNGKVLPVGAYLYVINPNNDSAEYKGTISIVH